MGGPKPTTEKTLYDRLGGDPFINLLTCAFFDEIVENETLKPFFKHISKSALKCHQVKLFRVIFGREEEKPENEDILDFMLRTHTRLFRELGLDANHFDQVATCFVQGLETFQVDQSLIDECVAILVPLRVVFEYGAQVAAREKTMTEEERKSLPCATPQCIGTDTPVVLPEYSKIEIPEWLPEALGKHSNSSTVRAWTCDLTNRFGAEGDAKIADTFMDQPYMDHHVYLVAFLELAFLPEDVDPAHRAKVLEIVLFPRGPKNAPLSRELFDRMIAQFLLTCHMMGMSGCDVKRVEKKLQGYRRTFAEKTTVVGGVDAPHILLKVHIKKKKQKRKARRKPKKAAGLDDSGNSGTLSRRSSSASLTSLTLLDFSEDDSCSATSGITLNSYCSSNTGVSGKSKKGRRKGSSRWSIFKSLMGSKSSSSKSPEPKIPTSITA